MTAQRNILAAAIICATFLSLAGAARAQQAFPVKPIRVIVPNPPGGATDVLARIIAEELTPRFGKQVVVENRPGASGTIGSNVVAKAVPDGYNMVMGHAASHATSPSMYRNLPYDPISDFAPVTLVANVTNVIILHPSIPAKSVKELVALAKARPGQLVFGSGGPGAITHLAGELFKQTAGVNLIHVAYKGSSQAMADLLGGHISLMFENLPGAIGQIKAGRLRALAVLGHKRSGAVPNLPTIAEAGLPGSEADSWFGLFTTAGTPKDIVERLNREVVAVIRKPDIQSRMAGVGAEPVGSSPEDFGKLVRSEKDKWAKVIKAANIPPAS
jgi:tripartite-type tricarboxylate transporter receptor subunit TctC